MAVRDHIGLAKLGLNQLLVDGIVQRMFEHLAELGMHFCPFPLAGNHKLETLAAMLAVKYFDHLADKKPLTKVCCINLQCIQSLLT